MTAVNPVQFLSNSTGTDLQSLALKMYSGSFASAPRPGVLMYNGAADRFIYRKRPQNGGKSFQYLMGGEVPEPEDYNPGEDLLGQAWAIDEGEIISDGFVMCHQWIGLDRMQDSHMAANVMPFLGERHRNRLERLYDKRAFIMAALTGRDTSAVTKAGLNIHQGATRVTRTGETLASSDMTTAYPLSATGAANLRADIKSLGLALDRKDIAPGYMNRSLVLDYYLKTVLTYDATAQVFSKEYVTTNDQQKHQVDVLENFTILGYANGTSRNGPLPNENIITGPTRYQGNFTAGASNGIPGVFAFCRSSSGDYGLGLVEFTPVTHFVKYFEERLSWLVMSYMRCGVNKMHKWCIGTIEATNT